MHIYAYILYIILWKARCLLQWGLKASITHTCTETRTHLFAKCWTGIGFQAICDGLTLKTKCSISRAQINLQQGMWNRPSSLKLCSVHSEAQSFTCGDTRKNPFLTEGTLCSSHVERNCTDIFASSHRHLWCVMTLLWDISQLLHASETANRHLMVYFVVPMH